MAFGRYYRFGAQPPQYAANWHGLPPAATRRGNRQLGEADMFESSAPVGKRYPPLTPQAAVRRQRGMGDDSIPMRPSGPEPLDPGEIAKWQDAYIEEPGAQPVGAWDPNAMTDVPTLQDDRDRGPAPTGPASTRKFGLSRNEQRMALLVGAGALAFLYFKKKKK